MQKKLWVFLLGLFLVSVISGCWADQAKEGDSSNLKSPSTEGGIEIDPKDTAYRARAQKAKCSSGIMSKMKQCLGDEYRMIEARLNDLYEQAAQKWSNLDETKQAQAAWTTYRDVQCSRAKLEIDPDGSQYLYAQFACFIHHADERIERLEKMLSENCKACFSDLIAEDIKSAPKRIAEELPPEYQGKYKLVKGGDVVIEGKVYPLCKDLLKNFNSFPDERPMVCERKFRPELGFTTPDWQPVRTEDIDWEVLKQIYFSKRQPVSVKPENEAKVQAGLEKSWLEERIRLKALAEQWTILWQAEFDIDNKGDKEKVLMLRDADCNVEKYFGHNAPDPSLHVLQASDNKLNNNYDRLSRSSLEAFHYKNHTYLSKWMGGEIKLSGAQLFIFYTFKPQSTFGYSNKHMCAYQYIQ